MTIEFLIQKKDTKEIVRDKIAQILVVERDNQKALAVAAGEDPALWDFYVYVERFFPWSLWQNTDNLTPIVNIWFQSDTTMGGASDVVQRQTQDGKFNIDVYARGANTEDGSGQLAGDKQAMENLHRTIRLIRNILMAGEYTYLDLRGLVGYRMPDATEVFQPELDDQNALPIIGGRMRMSVRYNELSPQAVPSCVESIVVNIEQSPSGEIVTAEYDFSQPNSNILFGGIPVQYQDTPLDYGG